VVSLVSLTMIGLSLLVLRTSRIKKIGGFEDLIGLKAKVVKLESETNGQIELRGEIWSFTSTEKLQVGDLVEVFGHTGFVLNVKKEI